MDTERLGLSPDQQALIDNVYVDTALNALTQQTHYLERAALVTQGDVADELKEIHLRAYDQAHTAI